MKTVISTPKAPAAIGPYSQAIRKGGTLYLSGQIGMVPATGELVSNDVKEQAAQALAIVVHGGIAHQFGPARDMGAFDTQIAKVFCGNCSHVVLLCRQG